MARDCPDRARGSNFRDLPPRRPIENSADSEYEKLMNELGGGEGQAPARQIGWDGGQGDQNGDGQANVRPWQRGATGAPAPWAQGRQSNSAPWNSAGRGGGYDGGGYNNAPSGPPGGSLPPWQQNRGGQGGAAPWATNGNGGGNGGGYGGHGGHGGGAPWQQPQHQQWDAPPPPPPGDEPPPPPPPPA